MYAKQHQSALVRVMKNGLGGITVNANTKIIL